MKALREAVAILFTDLNEEEFNHHATMFHGMLSAAHRYVLLQLVTKGPVWDGDIASKSARDDLISLGLASCAYVKGQSGYTVANYVGGNLFFAVDEDDT